MRTDTGDPASGTARRPTITTWGRVTWRMPCWTGVSWLAPAQLPGPAVSAAPVKQKAVFVEHPEVGGADEVRTEVRHFDLD